MQVARKGLLEPFIFGAAAVVLALARPKTAPGPSERSVVREERYRKEVAELRDELETATPEEVPELQEKLKKALARLAEVEKELKDAEIDLENYPVPDYLKQAYGKGKIMIAITGAAGVGKSSWINAARRLRMKDTGAAPTGITETTREPTMYSFPGRVGVLRRTVTRGMDAVRGYGRQLLGNQEDSDPIQVGDRVMTRGLESGDDGQVAKVVADAGNGGWDVELMDGRSMSLRRDQLTGVLAECVLWDLPGVGTPTFPQATYVKRMGIRYFDVVLLMTATRFTEAELMLVEELNRWKVPYFLVRNKADADVDSEVEREEEMTDTAISTERRLELEKETIETIKEYYQEEFKLERVYCISTKRKLLNQFDFLRLERDIEARVKEQRVPDPDMECPVCFELYTEKEGPPGHKRIKMRCPHVCCEACWNTMDRCYVCGMLK